MKRCPAGWPVGRRLAVLISVMLEGGAEGSAPGIGPMGYLIEAGRAGFADAVLGGLWSRQGRCARAVGFVGSRRGARWCSPSAARWPRRCATATSLVFGPSDQILVSERFKKYLGALITRVEPFSGRFMNCMKISEIEKIRKLC